jgi:hypothetical protein
MRRRLKINSFWPHKNRLTERSKVRSRHAWPLIRYENPNYFGSGLGPGSLFSISASAADGTIHTFKYASAGKFPLVSAPVQKYP